MVDKVGGVEFDVDIDATGAVAGASKIVKSNDSIEDSFREIDSASSRSAKNLTKGAQKSTRALGGFSRQAGQAGIQFQQLVGQIQGGQNVFGAVSAQAADLGIVLGAPLVGAIAGISAAFAGALVPSLFNSKSAMEQLEEVAKEMSGTLAESETGVKVLSKEIAKLAEKSEDLARIQIAKSLKDASAEFDIIRLGITGVIQDMAKVSLKGFNDTVYDAGISFDQLADKSFNASDAVDALGVGGVGKLGNLESTIFSLQNRFDLTRDQAVRLASAISAVQKESSPLTIQALQSTLSDLSKETDFANEKMFTFAAAFRELFDAAHDNVEVTNLLRRAMGDLNGVIDESGNAMTVKLTASQEMTKQLSEQLAVAGLRLQGAELEALKLSAAFSLGLTSASQLPVETLELLEGLQKVNEQQRINSENAIAAKQAELAAEREAAKERAEIAKQFADVEGSNTTDGQSELEAVQAKFAAEREAVMAHHQMLLQLKKDGNGLTEEEEKRHADALNGIKEREAKATLDIKEKEEKAKLQAVSGALGNMSQLMNTESRKLFEIGKAAALANAVVTGYDAATTNYKKGSEIGGPPVGAAFAAASLAATFAQIQSIRSTQFGGGAGGGQSIQGGQVSNTGSVGPQQPAQNVSVSGIDASSLVSGQQLLDLLNEYAGDGGSFNFAGG